MDRDRQHGLERRSVLRAMGAGATLSGLDAVTGDGGGGLAALRSQADPTTPGAELGAAMNDWFAGRSFVSDEQCAYPGRGGIIGEAADFELYGPTDINAQTSNGSLAVGISDEGTLTVFRWPRPSFFDQLKYKTNSRAEPPSGTEHGKFGAYPNAGAFLGLLVDREDGTGTDLTWLREDAWAKAQAYTDDDADPTDLADSVRTEFRNDGLGLTVVVRDVVARGDTDRGGDATGDGDDVLYRDVMVARDADSPVETAKLAAFENLNLVVSKKPKSPTRDWCEEEENRDIARYLPGADAIVHEAAGTDTSTGEPRRVAVAMGFAGESDGHQVGGDAYEPTATPAGQGGPTQDAYDDLRDGELQGNDRFAGQTTGAMVTELAFEGDDGGTASEAVLFTAGETAAAATSLLGEYRTRSFASIDRAKRDWIEHLLEDPPLPDTDDTAVLALCKRALVTLVTSYDPRSGAIVASIATQAPYGEDWVRDGAFFNYGLGMIGRGEWIDRRNRWYAEIQQSEANPHPTYPDTPRGNWPMNHYADGVAGGPIDWEIDETGYGIWTIVDHYELTGDEDYLEAVWPAIERAADFLVEWKDPRNNLQAHASEDDHPEPTQSIIGAATVWLGLGSAVTAAEALGEDEKAATYRARRSELRDAAERLLYAQPTDGRAGFYGKKKGFPMAPLAWPICWDDYDSHRMRNHLHAVWQQLGGSFAEPAAGEKDSGLYESKGLVPLAQATRDGPVSAPGIDGEVTAGDVKDGIDWIANRHATPDTHIMGEIWIRREGEVKTTVSQPHVWEQILFYLAALEAYPPTDEYDLSLEASCGGVIDQLRHIETNGSAPGRSGKTPDDFGAGPGNAERSSGQQESPDGDEDEGDAGPPGGDGGASPFPWPMPNVF
ncbi:hypothetical protein [Haloglomus litoreum]|uniref:hypothetical protein n=1 Tax=Haloglomus litoreum TaxID=3034026 RepID=UPI0023E857E4|nr:hypothetical protein [Haloglomus sp. DT116]